jgi:hypothetical protein
MMTFKEWLIFREDDNNNAITKDLPTNTDKWSHTLYTKDRGDHLKNPRLSPKGSASGRPHSDEVIENAHHELNSIVERLRQIGREVMDSDYYKEKPIGGFRENIITASEATGRAGAVLSVDRNYIPKERW